MSPISRSGFCPLCGTGLTILEDLSNYRRVYSCPVCGRFEDYSMVASFEKYNLNHLASYLTYNGYPIDDARYYSNRSEEYCSKMKHEFETQGSDFGFPVQLKSIDVENWYPKRFFDKVDFILQWIETQTPFWGSEVFLENEKVYAPFFVNQFELRNDGWVKRPVEICNQQLNYVVSCLANQGYIDSPITYSGGKRPIQLTPKGYSRLDDIKTELTSQKQAFIAMKFGNDTINLRSAIKKGISDAGYIPILIDETDYNGLITPEILKRIQNSKFVVVDLTHQNNGAYFEEGYAMGLGKPVIQLCSENTKLHLDLAQKNTIMWANEEDIPERLCKRILATIE